MNDAWQPFTEPVRTTLIRTFGIALVMAAAIVAATHARVSPAVAIAIALWPSFGGHLIEIFFLNWLRPRLPGTRSVQLAARMTLWIVSGAVLALLMSKTAALMSQPPQVRVPLLAGAAGFLVIELVAHCGLELRGSASFYNGRG